jgi:MFS family permease
MAFVLGSPRVRRIVLAYTINRLGTWFGYIALSLAVYAHTHSALAVAALLVAAEALPALVVPLVVARVEASTRRAGLSALFGFEALTTAALAFLLTRFWLPAVLLLAAVDGAAALAAAGLLRAAAARAAREARETVARSEGADVEEAGAAGERDVNAALNIAFSVTFVIGPGLAGLLVAATSASVALLLDAGTFVVAGLMLLDFSPRVEPEAGGESVRERVREAWAHVNSMPVLRALLIAEGIALVFFAADAAIEVPYATVTLGAGDGGYGLILTVWGIGTGVGSVLFARAVHRALGAMLAGGSLAVGLAYIGFAFAPTLALACVASLVGGIGNGVQWASLISAVQQLTPPRLHGQLMGAAESIAAVCPAAGLLLGGGLVAVGSPRSAFLVVGIGATLMTFAFVRLAASAGLSRQADTAGATPAG